MPRHRGQLALIRKRCRSGTRRMTGRDRIWLDRPDRSQAGALVSVIVLSLRRLRPSQSPAHPTKGERSIQRYFTMCFREMRSVAQDLICEACASPRLNRAVYSKSPDCRAVWRMWRISRAVAWHAIEKPIRIASDEDHHGRHQCRSAYHQAVRLTVDRSHCRVGP